MIGQRLALARKAIKLKQAEFGEKIEATQAMMSKYEQGGNIPLKQLEGIASVFGISLDWLITGEGSMFKSGAGKVHNVFGGNNIFSEINHGTINVGESAAKDEFELLCDEVREADEKKRLKIFHMVKLELLS